MAEFLDEQEVELQEDETLGEFEEAEEPTFNEEPEEEVVDETPEEDDLPDKYRGKSVKEIVQMHQEAEKLVGRQSSEVGELRKLVDNYILSQQVNNSKPKQEEPEIDFFEDPKKAVEYAVSNHPKLKQAEAMAAQMAMKQAQATLQAKHPDFGQIVSSPEFQNWVAGSKVRQQMFKQANDRYDFDVADELLSTWKERQNIVAKAKDTEEQEIKRQRKAASTGGSKGGGEAKSKKIYRRADIINLMQRDPERYAELQDEITRAYAEKRVR